MVNDEFLSGIETTGLSTVIQQYDKSWQLPACQLRGSEFDHPSGEAGPRMSAGEGNALAVEIFEGVSISHAIQYIIGISQL